MKTVIRGEVVQFEEKIAGIRVYSRDIDVGRTEFYFVNEKGKVIKIMEIFLNYSQRISDYIVDYKFEDVKEELGHQDEKS